MRQKYNFDRVIPFNISTKNAYSCFIEDCKKYNEVNFLQAAKKIKAAILQAKKNTIYFSLEELSVIERTTEKKQTYTSSGNLIFIEPSLGSDFKSSDGGYNERRIKFEEEVEKERQILKRYTERAVQQAQKQKIEFEKHKRSEFENKQRIKRLTKIIEASILKENDIRCPECRAEIELEQVSYRVTNCVKCNLPFSWHSFNELIKQKTSKFIKTL